MFNVQSYQLKFIKMFNVQSYQLKFIKMFNVQSYQLKFIKMRVELANRNHCAVPFLSSAAVNLSWYDSIFEYDIY